MNFSATPKLFSAVHAYFPFVSLFVLNLTYAVPFPYLCTFFNAILLFPFIFQIVTLGAGFPSASQNKLALFPGWNPTLSFQAKIDGFTKKNNIYMHKDDDYASSTSKLVSGSGCKLQSCELNNNNSQNKNFISHFLLHFTLFKNLIL